jgi:hypothetical protein
MERVSALEGTHSEHPSLAVEPPSETAQVDISPKIDADMRNEPGAFHYGDLPVDVAETVQRSAKQIRGREADAVQALFDIGRELKSVKGALPHGRFGSWLQHEFGWTERTAQRYMQAAEVFGDKADTVSVLGATAIHALAAPSTPETVRAAVVARLEAGEHLTPRAVLKQVKMVRHVGTAQSAASAGHESKIVEQRSDEAPGDQPSMQGWSAPSDEQRDHTPAQLAAELILEHVGNVRGELAGFLADADPEELRVHLLQGCSLSAG